MNFIISPTKYAIVGRSMENGIDMNSQIVVRGIGQTITSPSGFDNMFVTPNGLTWTTKYGYVGLNVNVPLLDKQFSWIADGMNSEGLSIAMQTLPETVYQTVGNNLSKALAVQWFCDWVLGTCASVNDIVAALPNVIVWGVTEGSEDYTTAHFSIFDSTGQGLVIEFINGKQVTYTNTIGVCTNGPTFDWHLTNIGNYTGLTPTDATPININGVSYSQPGHGSGLMGIPGDSTPPSRFVRMAYFKQFVKQADNAVDEVNTAFHLLNTIDIPIGTSQSGGDINTDDYTQYVTVRDLINKLYYIRMSYNTTPIVINLENITFSKATFAVTSLSPSPIFMPPPATDVTSKINLT